MHAYMHTGMTDPLRQTLYVLPQMLSHANACMHALARHPPNGKLTALVLVVVLLPPLNREPRIPCDLQALLTHSMAEISENVVSPGLSVDRGCGSPDSVDDEVFIENSVGLAILETANCTGPDDHTLVGTRRYIVLVLCLWRRVRGSSSHPSPFCDAASSPFWLLLRTQQRASRIWTLPLQQLQQQILLGPDPTTMRRLMTRPMWRGQLSRLRRSK